MHYGFSHRNTVLIIYAVSAVLALCGLTMTYLSPTQGIGLLVLISIGVIYGAVKLGVLGSKALAQEAHTPEEEELLAKQKNTTQDNEQ